MDDVIGNADPDMAEALVNCARAARTKPKAFSCDVAIGKYSLACFVKKTPQLVLSCPQAEFLVMIRADVELAKKMGLPTGKELDLFIGVQEQALNALVLAWRGKPAPFPGRLLRMDTSTPEGDWSLHLTSGPRHRMSNWFVLREGSA